MLKRVEVAGGRPKRLVSVGFIKPELSEGDDTIYVNLKLSINHPREPLEVEVVSRREFVYDEFVNQPRQTQPSNNIHIAGYTGNSDFSYFIERLGELNNARIDYMRGWREGALAFLGLSKIVKDANVLVEED